jgi:hypothetical protein
MRGAWLAFGALLLVGCLNEKDLIQKFAPKEDDEFARHFITLIREGRYDEASPLIDPVVADKAGPAEMLQLHKIVDHGEPIAIELIGANVGYFKTWSGSGSRQTNLVYQLQFRDAWVVATVVVQSNDDGRRIWSAFFQPVSDSLQVLNRFTLVNKTATHYLFLAAAILVPLFIVATMVICFRSRVRRRWLWLIFIVLGFVQFRLNWTTGAWDIAPISLNLLGASWIRASSYAPVILSFSIPVGAITFLICRRRLRRKDEPPPLTPEPMGRPESTAAEQDSSGESRTEIAEMSSSKVEPLWRAAIPDREPWRRGREAIIVISVVVFLGQAALIALALMSGHIESFFARLVSGWLAALLLYFVWIGQNWARWVMAPPFIAYGCWGFVWGIIGGDGLMIVTAIASLIIFSYLAIAPAVYAFARHQRERVTRWEVLIISGVFFLLFLSVGSAIYAFFSYQNTLEADANEFAGRAFHRVFVNRDPEFLAAHSSTTRKFSSPDAFINRIESQLGRVQNVGPVGANFRSRFVPYRLELRGTAKARVSFESSPAWVSIEISGTQSDWKIEHISWDY